MVDLNRRVIAAFYYKFIEALPYIGPKGLHPDIRMEWQMHPSTIAHLRRNNLMDADCGPERLLSIPYAGTCSVQPGTLQIALVSSQTNVSQPKQHHESSQENHCQANRQVQGQNPDQTSQR
jgi:hypothetical protein